jgi:transcriptional antiterminator RfaH
MMSGERVMSEALAINIQEGKCQWYAIRTQANKETLARLHYERQGYTVYLPLVRTTRTHARKREEVLRPLFPGYLFLQLDPHTCNWVTISSTRGAVGPVQFGPHFPPVPDGVIDCLRERAGHDGFLSRTELQRQRYKQGDKVEVFLGEGEPVKAIIDSFCGDDQVRVLLEMLQRQLKTTLSQDRIKLI